jgi:hypothetical protein
MIGLAIRALTESMRDSHAAGSWPCYERATTGNGNPRREQPAFAETVAPARGSSPHTMPYLTFFSGSPYL